MRLRAPSHACLAIGLLWLLGASGCGDKRESQLGKFLPGGAAATDALGPPADAYALAESDAVGDRLAGTTFAEVAARLGAHRYRCKVDFRFSRPSHHASLREEALIVQAANGDFKIKVDNDGGQGYELVSTGGRLWIRTRYGPFHERSVLDRLHLIQRDRAYGAWGALYRLFRGRLAFAKQGLARHFGRDALRYSIGLSDRAPRLPGTPETKAVPVGVTRYVYPIEPTPSDEHRWRDQAAPVEAQGSLLLDLDTGVVLKADLDGRLRWTDPGGEPIELGVSARIEADGFGNPASLEPPDAKAVSPLPERVAVDTHPLDFFFGEGFTAGLGPAAGVARKSTAEQEAEAVKSGGTPSTP